MKLKSIVTYKRFGVAAAIAAAALLNGSTVKANLLAYDPFDGSDGTTVLGSSGGFGFSQTWNNSNFTDTQTPLATGYFTNWNLNYSDSFGNVLLTSSGSAFFQGGTTANNSWQGTRVFNFSRGTNGTDGVWTWISMLTVRTGPENTPTGNRNAYNRGVNIVHDMNNGNFQKIGVGNGSNATTNTVAILSSGGSLRASANPEYQFGGTGGTLITNFIVLGIEHVAGGLDNTYMWVNPSDLTMDLQANLATATTNVLAGYDYSFDRLRIFVGGNANAVNRYGEIFINDYRLGETAADVMPLVPEPAVAVLGGLGVLAYVVYRRRKQ